MLEQNSTNANLPSLARGRILIVEDNEKNWPVYRAYLEAAGGKRLEFACNGLEGLEKVVSFQPDVVILDLVMPTLDGHDFLRRLRAEPAYSDLPVLVVAATTSEEERHQVFAAGGTDFMSKPIDGLELAARAGVHLRSRLAMQELKEFRDRVEHDLTMARKMQRDLLPNTAAVADALESCGIELDAFFEPSVELGGDLWGVRSGSDGKLAVYTVDFSGHGVSAALNTFRLHTLMEHIDIEAADCGEVLSSLNRSLTNLLPRGQFATMLYGVLDPARDRFRYASAGAPSLVSGGLNPVTVARHASSSLPLGIKGDVVYETQEISLSRGGFLFMYSDALSEMPDYLGRVLDEEGIVELLRDILSEGAMGSPVPEVVKRFRGPLPLAIADDFTLVWLARP